MRCDDYCPRCGEPEESVTHAIFECPPAMQVWSLSATPTSQGIFPLPSIYANMDYLFSRKNNIVEPDQDRDSYPWLIWYIWKARNNKFFRGINRDPLALVRYAESECQAWFNANEAMALPTQDTVEEPQVLSLRNICMIDGSWTSTAQFSGCGWVCMNGLGKAELIGTRNRERRESALHKELEALHWAMESMLQYSTCQSFGTDCKDLIAMIEEPHAWLAFATELERIETLKNMLPRLQDHPHTKSAKSDFGFSS